MSYSTYIKKSSINLAAFVRNTTGAIQAIKTVLDENRIQTTYANIGEENAYGINFNGSVRIGSRFSLNGGADVYYAMLNNNVADPLYQASNQGWVSTARLRASYDLGKGWELESFSMFRGRQIQLQGTQGGVLNDYVPFYFHYKMPMLHNIYKGEVPDYIGTQEEIIYLVSSAEHIHGLNIPFVFTDRHAYLQHKTVYNTLTDLTKLKWNVIRDETWYHVYTALRKELKQAEFLVYQHLPVNALMGIVCHNVQIANFVQTAIHQANLNLQVIVKPEYYYP